MAGNEASADTRTLCRMGGASAIVLAVSYVAITGLYVNAGPIPTETVDWLTYLSRNESAWWAIVSLSVLTDLLYLPIALALYLALASVNRNAMLAGAGLLVLFVILDLAITWPNYAVLISLSADHAAATVDAQRADVVATAGYPTAILDSGLLGAYIILVPGFGVLVIGLVMLRSAFGRTTAYLGVATGLVAIVAVVGPLVSAALATVAVLAAVLTLLWFLGAGLGLVRLSRT